MKPNKQIIAISAPVAISAAVAEGENKGPPSFQVVAYTGGALTLGNFDAPVVVDLDGVSFGKSLIANLDHDRAKRVGHVTGREINDGQLVLSGKVSAATESAREVAESAANGFVWQASIEAQPDELVEVGAGKTIEVNGQEFTGPLYVARKSTLKGFAFVSHGADDNTVVSIAASAASSIKEIVMKPEVKAWLKATLPSVDIEALSEDEVKNLEADYNGRQKPKKPTGKLSLGDGIEARKAETERVDTITDYALQACERSPYNIDAVRDLAQRAIDAKWTVEQFRLELMEATIPQSHTVFSPRPDRRINNRVLEAALCMTGRLGDHEKMFDDQTLQAAHDEFRRGIGLNQLILLCAEANGYNGRHSREVTIEAQRAAFGMLSPTKIQATQFSTINISTILSNVANKFLREGWMAVDQTPMNIAAIRPVQDFKQITTVSLTGDLMFRELSATGEIQHGTVGEEVYRNQADTYARMLAVTRQDIVNDDVSALTSAPRRLGRGGMLKLNDIFWRAFLNNGAFFTVPRGNSLAATALGLAGLAAAEVAFMSQTDPDGKPLGVQPAILLVPTALRATALTLMTSEKVKGQTDAPDANIWRGRFNVESSPYMHNTAYTGWSATAWYLLANPNEMPVIEIAALNGNVMPVVETADADFNVLGIQMRGYSDVGVALQEYRGGVRAIA
jgi:hypothetical protein